MSTDKQLGHLLQGHRQATGWTQEQLAQKAGISQARLSVLERHPGRLTVARLIRIMGAPGLEMTIQEKSDAQNETDPARQSARWWDGRQKHTPSLFG